MLSKNFNPLDFYVYHNNHFIQNFAFQRLSLIIVNVCKSLIGQYNYKVKLYKLNKINMIEEEKENVHNKTQTRFK